MPYESVDKLQKALTQEIFHYAKDPKKAAGRALGTLVEIIAFYALKAWGFERYMAIERKLPEYANPGITHNVEFSLHPSTHMATAAFRQADLPLTPRKMHGRLDRLDWPREKSKSTQLLSSTQVLRNACTLYEDSSRLLVAYLDGSRRSTYRVAVHQLSPRPFAVIECKRVGVEEGTKKGPQTIEKAKQGAYVAQSLSSLRKIRSPSGDLYGVLVVGDCPRYEPYDQLRAHIIASEDMSLIRDFVLTVGIVSNHGNWFTKANQNKELKVLAQSYDWLLFLKDDGISTFADKLLVHPQRQYVAARAAFRKSYGEQTGGNLFTKVRIDFAADAAIQRYFRQHREAIDGWFNVLAPTGGTVSQFRQEARTLATKNWDVLA